jgi:hypothetical protein
MKDDFISRVCPSAHSVTKYILEFYESKRYGDPTFTEADLLEYITKKHGKYVAPSTPGRRLRRTKQDGLLDYDTGPEPGVYTFYYEKKKMKGR